MDLTLWYTYIHFLIFFINEKSDTSKLTLEEKIDMIISGTVQLVNIKVGQGIYRSQEDDYDNVMGYFCSLNWSLHKYDPSKCKWKVWFHYEFEFYYL